MDSLAAPVTASHHGAITATTLITTRAFQESVKGDTRLGDDKNGRATREVTRFAQLALAGALLVKQPGQLFQKKVQLNFVDEDDDGRIGQNVVDQYSEKLSGFPGPRAEIRGILKSEDAPVAAQPKPTAMLDGTRLARNEPVALPVTAPPARPAAPATLPTQAPANDARDKNEQWYLGGYWQQQPTGSSKRTCSQKSLGQHPTMPNQRHRGWTLMTIKQQ